MELKFNPANEPWKLFEWLKNADFTHSGLGADYLVQYDGTNKKVLVAFDKTSEKSKGGLFDWLMNLCFMPLAFILLFVGGIAWNCGGIFVPVFAALAVCEVAVAVYVWCRWHPKTLFKLALGKFKCHAGMSLIYSSIRDELFSALKKPMDENNCTDVMVCGWSQGGGISEAFAVDFYTETGWQVQMITFGALKTAWLPRSRDVLDRATGDGSAQYENGSDGVPRLPLTVWGFLSGKACKHIGEKFSWLKAVFKTAAYHTDYGNKTLYAEQGV